MDILSRLLIALSLIAFGVLAYTAWNRWHLRHLGRTARRAPGLEAWRTGTPGILYFTTPECAPCRTLQRPALAQLQADLGAEVQVIEVDAAARPAVADHWGVLSVPTTFILDASGAPRHVNHGVTSAETLKRQVQRARRPAGGQGSRYAGEQVYT